MLAQASADISTVPADFVKWFVMMICFVAANWFMLRKAGGRREDPVHIKTPLETKRQPVFAEKKEIDAANARLDKIEERFRQDCQHLAEAGGKRMEKIMDEIHKMKDELGEKIDESLQRAYSRINEHEKRLARVEGRLQVAEKSRD